MQLETDRAKILKRLLREGWLLKRNGKEHDIYAHIQKGVIALPRHRILSPGVARSIAKQAGWK